MGTVVNGIKWVVLIPSEGSMHSYSNEADAIAFASGYVQAEVRDAFIVEAPTYSYED